MVLEIIPRSNASSAKAYYSRDEPSLSQEWHGKALDHFEQSLDMVRDWGIKEFNRLIDNRSPTGEKVTPRNAPDRICCWDVTVNVPKAVTLLRVFGKRPAQVMEAVKDANQFVMEKIEEKIATRVRAGGRYEDQVTGNGIWRSDYHTLARPVEGTPFPHDHIHNVLMNMTNDGERFKAAKVHEIMKQAPEFQAMFHERLRLNLSQIGYRVKGKGLAWSIEGVPKSAVKKMSPRRGLIEKWMEGRGKRSGKRAALSTREPKRVKVDLDALKADWTSRLTKSELSAIQGAQALPKVNRNPSMNQKRVAYLRQMGNHLVSLSRGRHGPTLER